MKNLVFFGLCLISFQSYAQVPIYVSEEGLYKLLRVNIGATRFTIKPADSASRTVNGLHLNNEVKLISGFTDPRDHFAVHDAFYFDLNMGLTPKGQQRQKGTEKEGRFGMSANFGYYFLAGYRNEAWGALGGIDFRFRNARAGGLSMPNLNGPLFYYSMPLVLRGEFTYAPNNPNRKMVAMLWSTVASKRTPYQSLRAELALDDNGRWWLCGQATMQKAMHEDVFLFAAPAKATFSQFMLGLRVGVLP